MKPRTLIIFVSLCVGIGSAAAGTARVQASPYAALTGTLAIDQGRCASPTPTGSWFQMTKGGGVIQNFSSSCNGGNYSLISPGAAGGIRLGTFQPNPSPTFDGAGGSLAKDIIGPVTYIGRNFSLATNPDDVQNAPGGPARFPAPSASYAGGTLTVDLSSLNATWNGTPNGTCSSGPRGGNGCYLQGARATGTYDQATHHWAVTWQATIHGGSFDGATGNWHLEGTSR